MADYTAPHIYPDVNHGFHNDTTPRYDEAAARLAWERTIAFFNQHLRLRQGDRERSLAGREWRLKLLRRQY